MTGLAADLVPEGALGEFVRSQRWFGSKSSDLTGVEVVDAIELRETGPHLVDALVDVRLGSGAHETYQVFLGTTDGTGPGPRSTRRKV